MPKHIDERRREGWHAGLFLVAMRQWRSVTLASAYRWAETQAEARYTHEADRGPFIQGVNDAFGAGTPELAAQVVEWNALHSLLHEATELAPEIRALLEARRADLEAEIDAGQPA